MEISINRLFNLIKRELKINQNSYIRVLIAIFFIQLLMPTAVSIGILILILMPLHTFKEYFGSPSTRSQILNLPASTEEKYIYNFITAFIIYPIALAIIIIIANYTRYLVDTIFFNKLLNTVSSLSDMILGLSKQYLKAIPMLGMVFFGNIYFKKQGGLKMLLYFIGFMFVLAIINILIVYSIIGEFNIPIDLIDVNLPEYLPKIIYYLMGVFFLVNSFIALKEKEV